MASNVTTSEQTSPFASQFDSIQWSQQAVATGPLFIGDSGAAGGAGAGGIGGNFANLTLPHW